REGVVFSGFLFVFIILSNLAVLLYIVLSKRHKSRTNFFIMHLAFADICNGMVAVLTDVIWKLTVEWHAGVAACKVVRYFQSVTTFASNYVLVSLSLDRLDAIARPLHFPHAARRSRVLIFTAWLLALLFSIPMLVVNIEKQINGMKQCWIQMSEYGWKVSMCWIQMSEYG
ncbi:Cardioacceleratory peptide receptor, partial [Lamellibrachia satsuma]